MSAIWYRCEALIRAATTPDLQQFCSRLKVVTLSAAGTNDPDRLARLLDVLRRARVSFNSLLRGNAETDALAALDAELNVLEPPRPIRCVINPSHVNVTRRVQVTPNAEFCEGTLGGHCVSIIFVARAIVEGCSHFGNLVDALHAIDHPNVARILGVTLPEWDLGRYGIVVARGQRSLDDVINDASRTPPEERVRIVRDMAAALQHLLHGFHIPLVPWNLSRAHFSVTSDGGRVLCNPVGALLRLLDPDATPLDPRYAAPEQQMFPLGFHNVWRGSVFSFGRIAFEVLTAAPLPDFDACLERNGAQRLRFDATVLGLPPALSPLVVACTQLDDARRPSFDDILSCLRDGSNTTRLLNDRRIPERDDATIFELVRSSSFVGVYTAWRRGASLDSGDRDDYTSLDWAVMMRDAQMAQLLLACGVSQATKDAALLMCAEEADWDFAELLLSNGATAAAVDHNMWGILHWAAHHGNAGIAQLSIARGGADVNTTTSDRHTALHIAAESNSGAVIDVLIANGAATDAMVELGESALHLASKLGNRDAVEALLRNNCSDIEAKNTYKMTPLLNAVIGPRHADIVRLLVRRGARTDAKNQDGFGALHLAVAHRRLDIVVVLVTEVGISIDDRTLHGRTALHVACEEDPLLELVEWLVEHNATVNAADCCNVVPLHVAAAESADPRVVELLLQHGANVNAATRESTTALHGAAERGWLATVQRLLLAGADVNAKSTTKRTALHQATLNGHETVVDLLIAWNASVDARDIHNRTPAVLAAYTNQAGCMQTLLKYNPRLTIRDSVGYTAMDVADMCGHIEIFDLIHEHINGG